MHRNICILNKNMQKDGREKRKYQMNKCINILKICKMETGVFLQETGKREIR